MYTCLYILPVYTSVQNYDLTNPMKHNINKLLIFHENLFNQLMHVMHVSLSLCVCVFMCESMRIRLTACVCVCVHSEEEKELAQT